MVCGSSGVSILTFFGTDSTFVGRDCFCGIDVTGVEVMGGRTRDLNSWRSWAGIPSIPEISGTLVGLDR
jgi:hypothetical protein